MQSQSFEAHCGGSLSRKINPVDTPPVYFNNLVVASCETCKHLGLLLDKGLAFGCHLEEIILRANKGIGFTIRPLLDLA